MKVVTGYLIKIVIWLVSQDPVGFNILGVVVRGYLVNFWPFVWILIPKFGMRKLVGEWRWNRFAFYVSVTRRYIFVALLLLLRRHTIRHCDGIRRCRQRNKGKIWSYFWPFSTLWWRHTRSTRYWWGWSLTRTSCRRLRSGWGRRWTIFRLCSGVVFALGFVLEVPVKVCRIVLQGCQRSENSSVATFSNCCFNSSCSDNQNVNFFV